LLFWWLEGAPATVENGQRAKEREQQLRAAAAAAQAIRQQQLTCATRKEKK